jgi:hypothetical protein
MGMRIGGSSNAWANQQSSSAVNWQQRHQNFKSLKTALQGNDLAGAQQAFAALSASNPNALANPNSTLSQMGKALQAGNLPAAQQIAQNWQSNQQSSTASPPATDPNAALASFLQTLTASTSQGNSAGLSQNASSDSSAGDSAAPSVPASVAVATTPEQVAQALVAFEKNLFDSLQLQQGGSSPSSTATGSATTAATAAPAPAPTTTDPNTVNSDLSAPAQAAPNPATAQGHHHHHHHHSGQGGGQLNSELSALIGQTSPDANGATAAAATGSGSATAGLDQSFKNLLTTLGVTGNNASLNSFLKNLAANSSSAQTTTA